MNTLRHTTKSLSRLRQAILLIIMMCGVSEVMGAITPTAPTQVDGVYQIGTAAELWGFAQGINNKSIAASANAVLTADIDMENENYPLIGVYNSIKYAGTFDGDGHTISNFKYEVSNNGTFGRAFFTHTDKATIKNFTLQGTMTINNGTSPAFIASIVGMGASTKIEDVHSAVDIVFNGGNGGTGGVRIIAGIAGRFGGTINRCRYSGTIDASNAPNIGDRIAGIVSEGNPVTMTNCLFDGTIKTACTTATHYVAGLFAKQNAAGNKATNCLVAGNFVFAETANLSNCGIICYQNSNFTATNCYYVEPSNLSRTGVTSGATAVGSTPWTTITKNLNGVNNNWSIKKGQDYPVPGKGHEHNYVSGVCQNSDGCNQLLQPATQAADGYYEIDNTGNLLWFGKGINDQSIAANSNARLTQSIEDHNMPLPEFSGIGTAEYPFAGIFDGQGHAVKSSFTTASGTGAVGMFAYLEGTAEHIATIKDLELEGTFNVTAAREGIGALVGYMGDYTLIDNVHSHVDIYVTNANSKYIGGIIGIMEEKAAESTTANLLCYHDTIDVTSAAGPVGGIVGDMRGGTIDNAIFDGTIKTANTSFDLVIGGIAGQDYKASGTNKPAYIKNSLSRGTITATGATSEKLGSIMGRTNQNVTSGGGQNASYYVNNDVTKAFGETDSHAYDTFTNASTMTKEELRTALGETNWAQGDNYPFPQRGGTHTHSFDAFGFCYANDGNYQPAETEDDYYIIDNAGKLYWFALSINDGSIAANSKAKVQPTFGTSIDLGGNKWGVFPMIGNEGHKFTGEFDGQGNTLANIQMFTGTVDATKKGMFIAASGANIHDFTVTGTFYIANNPGDIHGGITGETNGATYEDINSAIDVQCLAETKTVAQIGGFAGLANGGSIINRCRYSGAMTVSSGVASGKAGMEGDTHDAIGGLFGQSNSATITNCLFDGTIIPASTNSDLNVGGLIGYAESATTLKNSFSHGTITLPAGSYSLCGTVVGRGSLATSDKLYYTGTLPASGSISAESFNNVTGNSTIYSASGLVYSLGDANWYLAAASEEYYPVPKEGTHTHYYENGICISDGSYEEPTEVDGVYDVVNAGNLFWLAEQMNSSAIANNVNISLSNNVDMESKEFIGFNAFAGTFDGQDNTISNYKRTNSTTTTAGVGLFNTTASGATIKNLKIGGLLSITGAENKSCYLGGLVGIAESTSFVDVTCSIGVETDNTINGETNSSCIRIVGGMVGSMRGGTMNRCRYNGEMTLDASTEKVGDRFGGLIGMMQTTASTIDNCLFDGKIEAKKQSIIIGGIVGQGLSDSKVNNSLATGTLKLTSVNTGCGMIMGNTNSATITNSHYTTTNFTVGGNVVSSDYNTVGTLNDGTNWVGLQNTLNGGVQTIDCNWKVVTPGKAYPIPMAWKNNHIHTWDANGFCVDNDGGYQSLDEPAEGTYMIANGGQLLDFVIKINNGTIPYSSNAKLTADVNLNNVEFPGIGAFISLSDYSKAYSGTFDGQGHIISGYDRKVTSGGQQGFFNYAKGATIKDFKLEGTMTDSSTGQQHGSVIGWADAGTLVEDVHSSVNVTFTSTASQSGGFAGRTSGTFNRCSYSGTVSSSTAYNKIGGFIGCIYGGTLKNCLFDGTLSLSSNSTELVAGGLVGAFIDSNEGQIQNSLVNGTITIPNYASGKCGVVVGLVDRNSAISMTLYTTTDVTEGLTAAVGSITSGKTLTGAAKNVTSESWTNVNVMLNPSEGDKGNWKIAEGDGAKAYPQPMLVNDFAHTHTYNNGFCISDDNNYEPATKAGDGWYEAKNAGNLWWLVTNVNNGTLAKTTKIRLTADIDMEGEARGSWPGFCVWTNNDWTTAYQGIFDGQGHTISNYYHNNPTSSLNRRGFFNTIYNATIRKVNFEGTMYAYSGTTLLGVAVGSASGTSKIEDITSSVNIITNGASGCGGVVGGMENANTALTEMNRCRFNGTITLNNNSNKNVGGLVGELRSAIIRNSLFDGTITKATDAKYHSIGGLVGKVSNNDNSEIHRCLTHGTINLGTYNANTDTCGIVVGSAVKTIYLYKCYHTATATKVTAGMPYFGSHVINKTATASDEGATAGSTIQVDQLLGISHDLTEDLDSLYKAGFRTLMGEPNWASVEQASGNYIYPYKDESHIHKYSNGFCTSGDGEYEKPNSSGKVYNIMNGGQLYWFATHFNESKTTGEIPQDAEVQIMRDIDLEGDAYIYPGIGSEKYPFKGYFNGMGNKIGRYYRDIVNAENTGLINYAVGAKIAYFSIYGETNFNLASIKSFHGTVLGRGRTPIVNAEKNINERETAYADTMLITDVFSFVNVNCLNSNTRVLGGIAGRTSGGLHRSRYNGTIKGMATDPKSDDYPSKSGRQIGGLVANAQEKILISDCLFDGKIVVTCQEADTMRVSGILASNEKNSGVKITIKNCLFNGCLQLKHTYTQGTDGTGVKSTENGVIAGYWDSNLPKFVNNVYYLKTCTGMEDLSIGQWEGKSQQTGSTIATTEITPEEGKTEVTKEQWNEIFKALDEYKEVTDPETGTTSTTRNGNWIYDASTAGQEGQEEIPVPGGKVCHHTNDDGTSAYNQFGYCTICGKARPLTQDTDGKYKMELVSDLASFRDMVNDGDIKEGTVLNAKLTQDIDFANYEGEFGEPIGNSNFNRYLYNFDGQGYKLLNVKITTGDQYVGFFGFAGDDTHDCMIHDFTITGEIEVPYKSTDNDDKPMYMGVVGKMYRGKIYNVHSELTMRNTNPTRAMIGGIVGCCETKDSIDTATEKPLSVEIDKCSYTGDCYANAAGNMGGIVGQTSRYTSVSNCTFAGTVHHTYKGVNNQTNFSGIVGYNEEPTFQGVKNCVIAGLLNTDKDREYSEYGTPGNHKNAICGEDVILTNMLDDSKNVQELSALTEEQRTYISQYSGNYAWNMYQPLVPANSNASMQTYLPMEKFVNGELCAIMNSKDNAPADTLNGHPWGQILGYQLDMSKVTTTGSFNGAHTEGSPAQRVPIPGWFADSIKTATDTIVIKRCYKVVKDASDNYTADWYYFDDAGDTTPYPSDATSMKVKRIQYERGAEYLNGYISMCLPWAFTADMKPSGDTKCYQYAYTEGTTVNFTEITVDKTHSIEAGTPFIMYYKSDEAWNPVPDFNESGTSVALTAGVQTKKENNTDGCGIYGSFKTVLTGAWSEENLLYKINSDGDKLVKTTANSHCFPFRVWIKLPKPQQGLGAKSYVPCWNDLVDVPSNVVLRNADEIIPDKAQRYNTLGQKVSKYTKGIVIVNGKKYNVK